MLGKSLTAFLYASKTLFLKTYFHILRIGSSSTNVDNLMVQYFTKKQKNLRGFPFKCAWKSYKNKYKVVCIYI